MPEKPASSSKEFTAAFAIDKSKLTRIVNVVEQRLGQGYEIAFTTILRDGRQVEIASMDDLLLMDNTVRNPIKSLRISAAQAAIKEGLPWTRSEIGFGDRYASRGDRISISVTSADHKTAGELFAELEEQVERTILKGFVYRLKRSELRYALPVILFFVVWLLVAVIGSFFVTPSPESSLNLSRHQILEMSKASATAKTQEDKINLLFEVCRRQLESENARLSYSSNISLWRVLFLLLPVVLMIGSAVYAMANYYPAGVFLWGDYEEYYSGLVTRRRTLWTVVVLSLLVGAIANLFVASLPLFK
jgi:hypothetical protein